MCLILIKFYLKNLMKGDIGRIGKCGRNLNSTEIRVYSNSFETKMMLPTKSNGDL